MSWLLSKLTFLSYSAMLYASCFIISFSNVVSYNFLVFIIPSSRFLPRCGFDFVPFVSSPVIPVSYTAPIVSF